MFTRPFDGVGQSRECSEQQCRSGASRQASHTRLIGGSRPVVVIGREWSTGPAALVGSIASFQGLARYWMRPRPRQRRQAHLSLILWLDASTQVVSLATPPCRYIAIPGLAGRPGFRFGRTAAEPIHPAFACCRAIPPANHDQKPRPPANPRASMEGSLNILGAWALGRSSNLEHGCKPATIGPQAQTTPAHATQRNTRTRMLLRGANPCVSSALRLGSPMTLSSGSTCLLARAPAGLLLALR